MRSQREVEREYAKLLKEVATEDFYTKVDLTNRVNCYCCQVCHKVTKTRDIDSGVTPFIHTCSHCGGEAHSTFYRDIAPTMQPIQEWYRPTLKQVLAMRSKHEMLLDHVLQGGLDVREIETVATTEN